MVGSAASAARRPASAHASSPGDGSRQRGLGGLRLQVREPHRRQSDAGSTDGSVLERQGDGDGDRREVADLALELQVRPSRSRAGRRHANLGEQLGRTDRALEGPRGQVRRRDLALAVAAPDDDRRPEREHHRPEVAGRVGVRERAADRPEVAHDRIRDHRRGGRDRRVAILDDLRRRQLVVSDEGADPEEPVALLDPVEAGDPVHVDEPLRCCEAELHQRDQALASGEDLRVLAVLREELQRLLEGLGPVVLERCWEHLLNPPRSPQGSLRRRPDPGDTAPGGAQLPGERQSSPRRARPANRRSSLPASDREARRFAAERVLGTAHVHGLPQGGEARPDAGRRPARHARRPRHGGRRRRRGRRGHRRPPDHAPRRREHRSRTRSSRSRA